MELRLRDGAHLEWNEFGGLRNWFGKSLWGRKSVELWLRANTWSGEMGLWNCEVFRGEGESFLCAQDISNGIHFGIENGCPCVPSLVHTVVLLEIPFRDTIGSQVSDFLLCLLHFRRFLPLVLMLNLTSSSTQFDFCTLH